MYTHTYSDYVHHILNRSPSKAAYSFTRSSRFPEPKEPSTVQQPFLSANGFDYSDGSRYHQASIQEPVGSNSRKPEKGTTKSRSKSPNPHQRSLHDNKVNRQVRQQKAEIIRRPLATHTSGFNRSKSKSPAKDKKKVSPSKTYTQQLEEIDHVCKNKTLSGYYPTGYELSPTGKYILSNVKNVPAHSFGRSQQRYQYMIKSEDELGPGYYRNFSEFGIPKK